MKIRFVESQFKIQTAFFSACFAIALSIPAALAATCPTVKGKLQERITALLPNAHFTPDNRLPGVIENRAFIEAVSNPDTRESVYLTVDLVPLKEINDKVLKDKELANNLRDYHQYGLTHAVYADSVLGPLIRNNKGSRYGDFKSLRFRFELSEGGPTRAEIGQRIENIMTAVNYSYDHEVQKTLTRDYPGLNGLVSESKWWHLAGMGATFSEADVAARHTRTLFDPKVMPSVTRIESIQTLLEQRIKDIRKIQRDLASIDILQKTGILSSDTPPVLTIDAFELFRQIDAKNKVTFLSELRRRFRTRFKVDLDLPVLTDMHRLVTLSDSFSPSTLIERRISLMPDRWTMGDMVSLDFKALGSLNAYELQKSLARESKSIGELISNTMLGERHVTLLLGDRKKAIADTFERILGYDAGKIEFSGDDGIFFSNGRITTEVLIKIQRELNHIPLRWVIVPRETPSSTIVELELLEKQIRKNAEKVHGFEYSKNLPIIIQIDSAGKISVIGAPSELIPDVTQILLKIPVDTAPLKKVK